jgi:ribonucleoside-diphosphate reductase alpha chain
MDAIRRITTQGGYRILGTVHDVVQTADKASGSWSSRLLSEVDVGDLVMLPLGRLEGEPRLIPLPVLDQAYYAGDHRLHVPDVLTTEMAELVGYFMGDGSLHAKGLRFCVANTDLDVAERLTDATRILFGLDPVTRACQGYLEVTLQSIRLARWWHAAGFAKELPQSGHRGKGWKPHVPEAVLESNSKLICSAFVRGLFEADGTVLESVPSFSTSSETFADEMRMLLLKLGLVTSTRVTRSGYGSTMYQVRLRNLDYAMKFRQKVGFLSRRKSLLLQKAECIQAGNRDRIYLPKSVWDEVVPIGHCCRSVVISSLSKSGGVSRQTSQKIAGTRPDPRLKTALGYAFEVVTEARSWIEVDCRGGRTSPN